MIEEMPTTSDKVLAFKMSGKLHDEDYKTFVPMIDAAIAREGKVRLLAQFHDFQGWDLHALWDDTKFATTHCTRIERVALVGEKKWEQWMAKVCKPFTMARLRYFSIRGGRNLGRMKQDGRSGPARPEVGRISEPAAPARASLAGAAGW